MNMLITGMFLVILFMACFITSIPPTNNIHNFTKRFNNLLKKIPTETEN